MIIAKFVSTAANIRNYKKKGERQSNFIIYLLANHRSTSNINIKYRKDGKFINYY